MKKIAEMVTSIAVLSMSITAVAGTMGEQPSYAGFWAGVGGSYTYTTLAGQTNISVVSNNVSPFVYKLSSNFNDHMAPVVNAGYFYDLSNGWLVGAKGVYKYLGLEQLDQNWSTTFSNGVYQSAGIHTKIVQDYFVLLTGGYQFGNWLVYGGAGPAAVDVSVQLNGDLLPPTSSVYQPVNINQTRTIAGGAAQVGFEYLLPNRFTVDISYNFMASSQNKVQPLVFPSTVPNFYTSFVQNVQVVEQGVNITVNKYFF